MLEVLGVIGVLHKHDEVLITLKVVVELNDILVLHEPLNEAFLFGLTELVLVEEHFLVDDLLDDLLNIIKGDKILDF